MLSLKLPMRPTAYWSAGADTRLLVKKKKSVREMTLAGPQMSKNSPAATVGCSLVDEATMKMKKEGRDGKSSGDMVEVGIHMEIH